MTTTGAVALAAPASAALNVSTPTSWAYIDSAAPTTQFVNATGDAPVGAQVDASGTTHSTRAYFTFDLSKFAGSTVASAQLTSHEISVADCSKARTEQVWLTATATTPTWAAPPAEQVQFGSPSGNPQQCPSGNLVWDAATALQHAIDAGAQQATFELRLPDDQQDDPSLYRTFNHAPSLWVTYDHAPLAPSKLTVNGKACGSAPLLFGKYFQTILAVTQTDPDNDVATTEFDWWPVDHPDQVKTGHGAPLSNSAGVTFGIQESTLTDGATYAWRARSGEDGATTPVPLTGPWSDTCQFTVDLTGPNPPAVSSSDYPAEKVGGGSGLPGTFVFSPNGSTDVVGYMYGFRGTPTTYVAAGTDGTASVQITPTDIGPVTMTALSVDKAGNYSNYVDYRYYVQNNTPNVTCTPASDYIGQPRTCTITPRDTGNTGYRYQINNGPSTDVPAGPDGGATITVTPTDATSPASLKVRAKLTNGNLTGAIGYQIKYNPGSPTIDQSADDVVLGKPVQFTFHAVLPGSTSFTYTWGDHDPVTVPAGTDGTATVSLITDQPGGEDLFVHSTTADGTNSGDNWLPFNVDSNSPTWSSPVYSQDNTSGGVGVTGTFVLSSPVPNVVSYTYWFDQEHGPVTVPAGADGTASVEFTPTSPGPVSLELTGNFADGTQTQLGVSTFYVN